MTAPRADLAEIAQQLTRIDRACIDFTCKRRKLLTRDPGNFVSNRRCGSICRFDPR
jgi:hypothetical protein